MITFNVLGATFTEEYGGSVSLDDKIKLVPEEPISEPQQKRALRLRVRCDADERISLSTGERLSDLNGYVILYPQVSDFKPGAKGIGVMSYHGAPQYFIEAHLPPNQFEALLQAACLGRIPSSVTVQERGMTLPDEFSMKWDEKKAPHLHIASIDVSVPLGPADGPKPPDFEVALLNAIDDITGRMKWIIGLLVLGLAIALTRVV